MGKRLALPPHMGNMSFLAYTTNIHGQECSTTIIHGQESCTTIIHGQDVIPGLHYQCTCIVCHHTCTLTLYMGNMFSHSYTISIHTWARPPNMSTLSLYIPKMLHQVYTIIVHGLSVIL